jgi:antitoxin ParD1/3/4
MADTISITPELQQLVEQGLASGNYGSRDELLLEAMRLLARRDQQREELRRQIQIGRDQIDRGEYTEYDEVGLRERFEQLKGRAQQRIERHGTRG